MAQSILTAPAENKNGDCNDEHQSCDERDPRNWNGHAASSSKLFLRRHLLLDREFGERMRCLDQPFPVALNVLRRAAFVGDRLGNLRRGYHLDRVPRAPAFAQCTADAPVEVDVAK